MEGIDCSDEIKSSEGRRETLAQVRTEKAQL